MSLALTKSLSELTDTDRDTFWRDGCLVVKNALSPIELAALQNEFNGWVAESRQHDKPWGEIADGRPRFDLEPGHSAERPALRRVNSPTEISAAYDQVMAESRIPALVADLIGPNVKFHHAKINSKLPAAATQVKWHQDFPFTPHSNDDLVTALIFVDDVTAENGPLEVLPGSHKGPLYDLWHDGRFTGAVSTLLESEMKAMRRPSRQRLLYAHQIAARLGAEPIAAGADTVHLRLFGRGRDTALAQSAAEFP